MALVPSERVTLPIGLRWEGKCYREVVIDEMMGIDEENVANKRVRNNGAKAMTVLLQRCIQEIPGLVPAKKRSTELIDKRFVNAMFTSDRDFLFLMIRLLGSEPSFEMEVACPKCGDRQDVVCNLMELDVYDWPDAEDPELNIQCPKGFEDNEGNFHNDVVWRFPTGKDQENLASQPKEKLMTSLIACCIKEVKGLKSKPDSEMIRRLRSRDRMAIMQMVNDNTPGVDLRQQNICGECDHEWEGGIDLSSFFNVGDAGTQKTTESGTRGRMKRRKR